MLAGTLVGLITSIFVLLPGGYEYQNEEQIIAKAQILEIISTPELNDVSTTTSKELLRLCNCVTGLRSFGVDIPYNTDAKDIQANTTPYVGGVVLFLYDNDVYHAALIIEMLAEYMIVKETNFIECKEGTRKVYYDDPSITGFYSP